MTSPNQNYKTPKNFLDNFLKNFKSLENLQTNYKFKPELFLILAFAILAIILRILFIDFQSGDYSTFLSKWWHHILDHGLLKAYGQKFSDYPPSYLYLMGLASLFTSSGLIGIKVITFIFDFVAAFWVAKLVANSRPNNKPLPYIAFFSLLFAPTVVMNGAIWGQSDIIFTSFCLFCLYYIIRNKPRAALIAFSLAFAFKIQTIFLLPILIIYLLRKPLKTWLNVFWIPIVYILFAIPSAIQGRGWIDLLTIYAQQASQYRNFSLGLPNLLYLVQNDKFSQFSHNSALIPGQNTSNYFLFSNLGILLCASFCLAVISLVYVYRPKLDTQSWLQLSLITSLGIPFLLPNMHERYYFLADILALVLAFVNPSKIWVAILISLISFVSYFPFLFDYKLSYPEGSMNHSPINLTYLVFAVFGLISWLCYDLVRGLSGEKEA